MDTKIKLHEVEITDLAFDGKAVGHIDGKVIFLKGGLPGETVLCEITRDKRRYYNGITREIIKKSEKRIDALCKHFEECGGCTWLDLKYEDQLAYKQKQVKDCIERIGALSGVEIAEIVPSVEQLHYRNKMEYSFNRYDDTFTLGLHKRGSFHDIFNLDECHISQSTDGDLVRWMRDYIEKNDIPVYDVTEHHGYMRFFMLRQTKQTDQLMVNIVTNYGDFPEKEKLVSEMTQAFPQITTIIHGQNGQKSNIAVAEVEETLYGPGFIEEKLFGKRFRITANSFFQTNSLQAEVLYATGFEMLKPSADDRLLDLYCGTGTIGILVADKVSEVVGVELVSDAVIAAKINAEVNNVANIQFFEGFVKEFLKSDFLKDKSYNIVIVDPPRAGLNPKALKELVKLNPEKILYISCNPATFARDAQKLVEAGFLLPKVKPVDMFPHTMHIELASVFYRG
ncbi:MAG: 23S rRNA (uracil(1939)-C(5))-methyltransferase RlmD [Calditrichaeota bacterium]|nr:MAG: 23S rRNA (uracil(1939)-C(5))-methyltransferase RlmD [Calditrichota bacterium]